jgi:phage shock protein A
MGILTRFTDIMKSNINALLDKCEDPAKMIDQTLRDLREDLAEVKKETANIIADAKSADRQVKECEEEITKYTTAAQNALKAGNEDDARTLIAKKQQYESNLVSYKKTQELTHANADKMRQMHDKLVNDIETLEARRDAIKATVASAKAQEHINKIVSAEAELNAHTSAASTLADKYTSNGSDASVEDELAAMKAKLGL